MSVIYVLLPLSLVLAGGFLVAFLWAVRSGQYEDTSTPSLRVLMDDGETRPPSPPSQSDTPSMKTKP